MREIKKRGKQHNEMCLFISMEIEKWHKTASRDIGKEARKKKSGRFRRGNKKNV